MALFTCQVFGPYRTPRAGYTYAYSADPRDSLSWLRVPESWCINIQDKLFTTIYNYIYVHTHTHNNNNNNNLISIAVYTKALYHLTIEIKSYTKEKINLNTWQKKTNTQIINYNYNIHIHIPTHIHIHRHIHIYIYIYIYIYIIIKSPLNIKLKNHIIIMQTLFKKRRNNYVSGTGSFFSSSQLKNRVFIYLIVLP